MENEGQPRIAIDELARMMANGFAEVQEKIDSSVGGLRNEMLAGFGTLEKRVLSVERGVSGLKYRVEQLDLKLDQHRQETKDGFADIHRVVGGMSHTLADHKQRLKELEGSRDNGVPYLG